METVSVESLCNVLARNRLVSPEEVRTLRQRWLQQAGPASADAEKFCKWLAGNRYVTDFQAGLLYKGSAERIFLGEYKLLDRIGIGRMAGVYKAVHRLGQTVAIKVLPPSKAKDPNSLARFQREARLAMRLKHPNIVRTFQTGQASGLHYLVMEYLEGETLQEVLKRRGKLPPAEAVRLIYQALLGLQCVHEQGMVHRDLNPTNLMLIAGRKKAAGDSTEGAVVKILDIGLGRALFDEAAKAGADNANLTADGTILGTPDYLAPEQARDSHAADIRSDIYSLGCTLFHALAGQAPFPDSNLVRKMVRHATEPVPALQKLNPEVPDGLQQILNWMMAKDPAQRYPTPERAAQALQVFLVAGTEPAPEEASEEMNAYLQWLDATMGEETLVGPATAAPTAPPRSAAAKTVTRPAAALATKPAIDPTAPDVELVPVEASAQPQQAPGRAALVLSRRDFMMVGVGIGGLLVSLLVAWLLAKVFRRKPAPTSEKAEE